MSDSVAEVKANLKLSQPIVAHGEICFSAFGPGWGYCSYVVPASVAMKCLGAKDSSASQLHLAFQLNRQRIAAAVAEAGAQDPGRPLILSNI